MVIRWIITAALLITSQLVLAAEFISSVDRKQIGRSDPVTLQLQHVDSQGGFLNLLSTDMPDLSPLERDWNVVGRPRISKESSNVNGKSTSTTRWEVELLPRRAGEVLIPALSYKGEYSDPIRINVEDTATTEPEKSEHFFFEVEVSSGTHYVQEQLLYIERMYYTVNHDDASLSEFEVANARVQPLMDPKKHITVVDGQRIGVYERRYAIFPESSGTLVIPGQRFTARVTDRYNRFRGSAETIVSKPIELTINPIPDSYPQAPWIPASRFVLEETFSTPPTEWQAGEPVTRTFTIKATGLNSGQVPPVPMADVEGLRYYPDQTQDNSSISEQGIVTTITQSVALVPGVAGELILPEVRIPWWNTLENRVEYATLPEHVITVTPAATAPPSSQTSPGISEPPVEPVAGELPADSGIWKLALGASVVMNGLLLAVVAWLMLRQPSSSAASAVPDHQARKEAADKKQKEEGYNEI